MKEEGKKQEIRRTKNPHRVTGLEGRAQGLSWTDQLRVTAIGHRRHGRKPSKPLPKPPSP